MLIGFIQFLAELFNLFLEFLHGLYSRVIVDNWPISDEGSLGSISKGGEILLEKGIVGVEAGDHKAIAIPSNRLFQDGCELGVTVGYIDLLFLLELGVCVFREDIDDLPKGEERFIDIDALLGQLALSPGHRQPF